MTNVVRLPSLAAEMQARMKAHLPDPPLQDGGGGGTSGGMSDDWKENVDRQLGQLHGDIRALLNRGVATVVALAVLIAGQYVYFNEKFEKVSDRIAALETKIEGMDARVAGKLDILIERTKPQ